MQQMLDRFLLKYRPYSTASVTSSELMFGRKFQCTFDLLNSHKQLRGKRRKEHGRGKKN